MTYIEMLNLYYCGDPPVQYKKHKKVQESKEVQRPNQLRIGRLTENELELLKISNAYFSKLAVAYHLGDNQFTDLDGYKARILQLKNLIKYGGKDDPKLQEELDKLINGL